MCLVSSGQNRCVSRNKVSTYGNGTHHSTVERKHFSLSYCVRTGYGTYAAAYAGKGLELGTHYSSPSISKFKNAWSYVHFVHLHGVMFDDMYS